MREQTQYQKSVTGRADNAYELVTTLSTLAAIFRRLIAGQDYVHGYSENPVVLFIEGDVLLQPGTAVSDVLAVIDETITVQAADGRTFTLKEAWQAGRVEVGTKEGQYRLRFEGTSCRELM